MRETAFERAIDLETSIDKKRSRLSLKKGRGRKLIRSIDATEYRVRQYCSLHRARRFARNTYSLCLLEAYARGRNSSPFRVE